MQSYSLRHVENHVLLHDLRSLIDQDRATTAMLLAHIAEVDRRRLYADAGYGSMFTYCVGQFDFSEDMAGRRITAARVARRFPKTFEAIADGRITVSALCLLSKTLKLLQDEAASDLLACAEHKSNDEIRILLAERFPQPDLAPRVRELAPRPQEAPKPLECVATHAPARVEVQELSGDLLGCAANGSSEAGAHVRVGNPETQASVASQLEQAPMRAEPSPAGRTTPLSPGRFGLQLTMSAETRDKLKRVQDLLAPGVPRNDLAQLLDRALDALIEKIERRRFGATDKPRAARPSGNARHIPAKERRKVTKRDRGQCTYVADSGRRCEEKGDLDFDHIITFADGGDSMAANLRLRCHAHNQLAAERRFGPGFMQEKRESARAMRALARAKREQARADQEKATRKPAGVAGFRGDGACVEPA